MGWRRDPIYPVRLFLERSTPWGDPAWIELDRKST
jgi:hypothetical protein